MHSILKSCREVLVCKTFKTRSSSRAMLGVDRKINLQLLSVQFSWKNAFLSQVEFTKRPTMSAAIQFHSQWYITKPASWVKPHKAGLEWNSKLMRNNMVSFTVAIKELEKIETKWLFTQSENKWTIPSLVSSVKWLYSFLKESNHFYIQKNVSKLNLRLQSTCS